jgi:hypothetical protein
MDKKIIRLIIVSILLVLIFGSIAYIISNNSYKKKLKETGELKPKNMGIVLFLNNGIEKITFKQILVGMVFGIVFGFVDNAGLWFGMDSLDSYLPSGKLTKAGFGNAYSNTLGTLLGTFISIMMIKVTNTEKNPIWTEFIGVIMGCMLGIYIPKAITGLD